MKFLLPVMLMFFYLPSSGQMEFHFINQYGKTIEVKGELGKFAEKNYKRKTFYKEHLGEIGEFHEGIATFIWQKEDLYNDKITEQLKGYTDTAFNIIALPKYTYAGDFKNGVALVQIKTKKGERIFYIDRSGKETLPVKPPLQDRLEKDQVYIGHPELAGYCPVYDRPCKIINTVTNTELPGEFSYWGINNRKFKDSLLLIAQSGKFGVMDWYGNWLLEPKYDWLFGFEDGFLTFGPTMDSVGIMNFKGEVILPAVYRKAGSEFCDGLLRVGQGDNTLFIDSNFKIHLRVPYYNVSDFRYGFATIKKEFKTALIRRDGSFAIPFTGQYDDLVPMNNEFCWSVVENGMGPDDDRFGVVSMSGAELIKPSLTADDTAHSNPAVGLIRIRYEGKFAFIDAHNPGWRVFGVYDVTSKFKGGWARVGIYHKTAAEYKKEQEAKKTKEEFDRITAERKAREKIEKMRRENPCTHCNASGISPVVYNKCGVCYYNTMTRFTCKNCKGTGYDNLAKKRCTYCYSLGWTYCTNCNGAGKVRSGGFRCAYCNSTGIKP